VWPQRLSGEILVRLLDRLDVGGAVGLASWTSAAAGDVQSAASLGVHRNRMVRSATGLLGFTSRPITLACGTSSDNRSKATTGAPFVMAFPYCTT